MNTIYLTGAIRRRSAEELKEFETISNALRNHGYAVTTCIDAIGGLSIYVKGVINVIDYREQMLQRLSAMFEKDMVLFLADYESEEGSCTEVRLAEEIFIPAYSAKSYLQTKALQSFH